MEPIFEVDVFNYLLVFLGGLFTLWLVKYHWGRRKLYAHAATRRSGIALPLIGHAGYFFGSNEELLKKAMEFLDAYESPFPVWLGQQVIFCLTDPKDLEVVMKSPHALQKNNLYRFMEPIVGHGLLTAPVAKWKKNRKLIMPMFNQKFLDEFMDVFSQQSNILTEQFDKVAGTGTVDLFKFFSRLNLDSICENAMGISVHAQTTQSEFAEWTGRAMEYICKRMFFVLYHFDFIYKWTQMYTNLNECKIKLHEFTSKVVLKKVEEHQLRMAQNIENPGSFYDDGQNKPTFLQHLIEHSLFKGEMTISELRDEVLMALIAGTDTTAATLCFIMVMLGMHPDVQNKAYSEAIDVLGPDRRIQVDDIPRLQYIELVIKESLRLFPIGPVLLRSVTADIKLEKCVIPAGSSALMGILHVHRNPKFWPDPMRFDPLRFLQDAPNKIQPFTYLPFSGGPRNCIGIRYATMIMKTVIASVLRKFKINTTYKRVEDVKLKIDLVLKAADGYGVSLERRN